MSARSKVAGLLLAAAVIVVTPSVAWAADPGAASRAATSLQATFPELAVAPRAPQPPAGMAVDEYVGADTAKLVDGNGRRSLLMSSLPLRSRVGDGSLQPLSLALRSGEPGEVRPQNPVSEVRIATDPTGGFTLGPDPDHLVTIVPVGLSADARIATAFAGQVLFAGARPQTDLLVRPSATGVQTFEQLNGAGAPETFSYRLKLTGDQTATLEGGVVTVRQGGAVIVQTTPPVALDAEHRPVPVAISLEDDVLRLDAPHRGAGFRYPIAVDPDWTSSYDYHDNPGLGLEGWHVEGQTPESPPAYYTAGVNRQWDGTEAGRDKLGFVIKPIATPAGRIFPTGVGAQLTFDAPGTTRIRSVTYSSVFRLNDRDRQTLRFVLRGVNFRENNDVFEAQQLSTDDATLPSIPFPEDVEPPGTQAVMWMFSSPCEPSTDLNCPPVIDSDTSQTLLKVGSVELVLTDFDFPTTQATGTLRDLQDRWTNVTDSRTLNPSAIDEGSGVRDLSLSVEDASGSHELRSIQSPCAPNHDQPGQDNAICPRTLDLGAPFSLNTGGLLDGRSTFTVDASDLADNTAAAGGSATAFSIYLDRKQPTTAASGALYDAASSWVQPRGPSQLTVTGTDTGGGGEGRTSGIAHNLLSAVDARAATVLERDADTCTPPGPITAPCDPGKASAFTINPLQLPEGPITFSAKSRDLAGNDSVPVRWTVRLDRTPPAARASGDLLGLTSQHTNSTTPTSVTLQGRDAASGVARLQLVAANSNGEKVLADRDTCPPSDVDPADGACPHNPSVDVTIDPGDLPDGPTTFIARAIDQAGLRSVDNQDWDTYVDHTPPDPPDSVSINETSNTSVQVTWPTVVDQPLGSGDVSYEYLVTAGGQPIGGWRPTTNPHAQVSDLPPGVTISVQVRAIDKSDNVSRPRQATLQRFGAAPPRPNTCGFIIERMSSHARPERRTELAPATRTVVASAKLHCFQAGAIGSTFGEVCLEWELRPGTKQFRRYDQRACSGTISSVEGATKRFALGPVCQPSSSASGTGNNRHRLKGFQGGLTTNGTPALTLDVESPENEYVRAKCPSQAERDRNEEHLWDALTHTTAGSPGIARLSAASAILRRALGPAPNAIKGAWDAHHIIAVSRAGARPAQRIAARCHLHPNGTANGLYLRSSSASVRRPHFMRDFNARDRDRSYHPDTFYNDYTQYVNDQARAAVERFGDCRQGAADIFHRLLDVSDLLEHGNLFTGGLGKLHAATG